MVGRSARSRSRRTIRRRRTWPPPATSWTTTRPYLFKTADYGATWTAITAGIPERRLHPRDPRGPRRPGLLYAGTETGVYVSFDDGGVVALDAGQPAGRPGLRPGGQGAGSGGATHGRSFWILDDLTPFHQFPEERAAHRDSALRAATGLPDPPTARVGPAARPRQELRHRSRLRGDLLRDEDA